MQGPQPRPQGINLPSLGLWSTWRQPIQGSQPRPDSIVLYSLRHIPGPGPRRGPIQGPQARGEVVMSAHFGPRTLGGSPCRAPSQGQRVVRPAVLGLSSGSHLPYIVLMHEYCLFPLYSGPTMGEVPHPPKPSGRCCCCWPAAWWPPPPSRRAQGVLDSARPRPRPSLRSPACGASVSLAAPSTLPKARERWSSPTTLAQDHLEGPHAGLPAKARLYLLPAIRCPIPRRRPMQGAQAKGEAVRRAHFAPRSLAGSPSRAPLPRPQWALLLSLTLRRPSGVPTGPGSPLPGPPPQQRARYWALSGRPAAGLASACSSASPNTSVQLSSAQLLPFNSSSPLPECLRWLCWPGQRRVPPHRGGGGWHGGAAPRARGAAPGDPLLGGPLSHQRTASRVSLD